MKLLRKIMKQKIKRLSAFILAGAAIIPIAATAYAADMFEANFVENNEANESFIIQKERRRRLYLRQLRLAS